MESQIGNLRYGAATRAKELEKRIAHLENLVDWLTGLLIDLIAIAFGIAAAMFVAGDYYRLSSVDGAVVFAFLVAMLSVNFICRKVATWCFD
jgi:membrane protein YdbS with pleckstrin-like domain